jgi:hypothetical protein
MGKAERYGLRKQSKNYRWTENSDKWSSFFRVTTWNLTGVWH